MASSAASDPAADQSNALSLREALRRRDQSALNRFFGPAGATLSFAEPLPLLRAAANRIPIAWLRHLAEEFARLGPQTPDALFALARAWRELGGWSAAEHTLRHALSIAPRHLPSLRELAELLFLHARLGEAQQLLSGALALHPGDPVLLLISGQCHLGQGDVETALAAFELAEEHAGSDTEAARNAGQLFTLALAYLPDVTAADLLEAAANWERRHAPPVARKPAPPPPDGRRLRVGYYSPDLRRHSIAHFFLPLLTHHDRAAFEIFLYSDTAATDAVTARMRTFVDHWRDLTPLPEPEAIRRIADDRLDLLVDLSGFFGATRPRIFAARPAPRQAHLLGYHGSTGLSSLDYRITDAISDPLGTEAESSEKLVRLPDGFHCFDALMDPLPEGPPPCVANGFVTFGSCNNLAKLNPEVVALWSRVLQAVPGSRLHLKAIQLHDAALRETVAARFAACGISADRLEILPGAARPEDHIVAYRRIDIALDPFPCNGVTTTCEALWMGVPVLTLAGARHSARVCSSLLRQIGLDECIATSPEDYIARAVALAGAPGRLADLRGTLRQRLAASPLGDAPAYARRIEAAFHKIIAA
jgi:Predicted O-linked N-acetylglucosamine transferase, SPINDLY family